MPVDASTFLDLQSQVPGHMSLIAHFTPQSSVLLLARSRNLGGLVEGPERSQISEWNAEVTALALHTDRLSPKTKHPLCVTSKRS